MDKVIISQKEYVRLKKLEKLNTGLLQDIAKGINDILAGKVRKI